MESVAFIQWCLDHLNYWTITLLMAIESSFIPFPSEVVVPPAAWKAANNDNMNIYLVVLFATIGANIGALINYYLAKWLGRPIIYKFANSRFGHMCLIDEAKVQHAEEYFDKHGAVSTFVGRLIPAVRQLISIPAGLARMKLVKTIHCCHVFFLSVEFSASAYLLSVTKNNTIFCGCHYTCGIKFITIQSHTKLLSVNASIHTEQQFHMTG